MRVRARSSAGQHSAEFALVIGLAGLVAVVMQSTFRRAIRLGIQSASDQILGADTAEREARREDADTVVRIDARTEQTIREEGDAQFHRVTSFDVTSRGTSVNEGLFQPRARGASTSRSP